MAIDPLSATKNDLTTRSTGLPTNLIAANEEGEFARQFQSLLRDGEALNKKGGAAGEDKELRKAFTDFVGQTLFGSLIASLRATQQEPAYMHGGQAEKIFQSQFDQVLAEEMTKSSADTLADPMYELFRMRRPT